MDTTISDEEIRHILDNCWEDIACFAYEGFNTNGRGVVGLEKTDIEGGLLGRQTRLLYVVYDFKAGKPDKETAGFIREYDPEWEVVIQYMREDKSVRTMRIRTAPGARHPWRIWLFNRLAQKGKESEERQQRMKEPSNRGRFDAGIEEGGEV